eukprot:1397459-Prymnesium_polylepis.1
MEDRAAPSASPLMGTEGAAIVVHAGVLQRAQEQGIAWARHVFGLIGALLRHIGALLCGRGARPLV